MVEQLLDKRNQDIANISHEFRTPLTLILGPVKQMLDSALPNEWAGKLKLVQSNSSRLLRMVEQLLSLESHQYRQANAQAIQPASTIIEMTAKAFVTVAEAKNITLSCDLVESIQIRMSHDGLDKICSNLLSNAIKYTPAGGAVAIHTSLSDNAELVIRVKDSGIGIAPENHDKVFNRFVRVMDDGQEAVPGAGIGLALVDAIVKAHHGSIAVDSELGRGTEITVRLPDAWVSQGEGELAYVEYDSASAVADGSFEYVPAQSAARMVQGKSVTLLIIEDNLQLRSFLVDILSDKYHCLTAENGEQGLAEALEHLPDLILSDIMMPKMDGFEVCRQIRAHDNTNHIPLMLLTAKHDKVSQLQGWQAHIDDYMTKPFDHNELLLRIDNLLSVRKLIQAHHRKLFAQIDSKGDFGAIAPPEDRNQQFIDRLNGIIDSHIADTQLKVGDIAGQLGMDEKQLNRKLKALLDVNAKEYVRQRRLLYADHLIKQGRSPSEVYFEAGFTSHTYFSRCYKAYFNTTPSQTHAQTIKTPDATT